MPDHIAVARASLRNADRNLKAMQGHGATGTQKLVALQQLANAAASARLIPTPHAVKSSPLVLPDEALEEMIPI